MKKFSILMIALSAMFMVACGSSEQKQEYRTPAEILDSYSSRQYGYEYAQPEKSDDVLKNVAEKAEDIADDVVDAVEDACDAVVDFFEDVVDSIEDLF